ncbi:GNAT family N-acetyltransferase [Roseburia sp. MUC/MUC-530-WT-4D]|uniref:GNAT family N-acetyltransferase n=1 Tax=Roseburia porci TaxID=2605790 RepID=A0A6L5YQF2_9FIRM|nr:GNAT family N-acetyltransferase [Roseburia porci]MCI5517395.1 GNAT family N-acetyltransferase [Roseburia sp.]MST73931.1 GNAT family N-acetyltransferase [Roseburia porci]
MEIRRSTKNDLAEITAVYTYARKFMKEHGNPNQWGDRKPEETRVFADIEEGHSYVCTENGKIGCVFSFEITEEPTYRVIDGKWQNEKTYGVIHRIATNGTCKGMASYCMKWAYDKHPNIRIDTHKDNIPMQSLLKKLGFVYCGTIRLQDGSERMAFQKT